MFAAAMGPRKGAAMSGTHGRPSLASYRDEVAELMKAGDHFGEVEDALDDVADLTTDEKAALWLFAFSLRDSSEQQRDARAHLAALQPGLDTEMTEKPARRAWRCHTGHPERAGRGQRISLFANQTGSRRSS